MRVYSKRAARKPLRTFHGDSFMQSSQGELSLQNVLLLVFATFLWGFNFVVIRWGLDEIPPLLFTGLRFAVCAFPAILLVPRPAAPVLWVIAFGLVFGVLQFGCLFVAMAIGMPAGLASLVMQAQVFFTILLALPFYGEKPNRLRWLALALGAAGLLLIAATRQGPAGLAPLALTLAGAASWAIANILIKHMRGVRILSLVVWGSLAAPLPLLGLSLWVDGPQAVFAALSGLTASGAAAIVFTSLGATLISFGIWGALLQRHTAAAVAPYALLVPVFGLTTAYLFLGETPSPAEIWASLIIFAALALNSYAVRVKPTPSPLPQNPH